MMSEREILASLLRKGWRRFNPHSETVKKYRQEEGFSDFEEICLFLHDRVYSE